MGGAFFMFCLCKAITMASNKYLSSVKFLVDANFYISVLVLLYGGFSSIMQDYSIFEFNEDLYGAIHTNLRIALLYLAATELVLCIYCTIARQPRMMLFVGYFLMMLMGSMSFYGKVNSVPIDENIILFFLYTGLSHIAYGLLSDFQDELKSRQSLEK
jgi:hypothetical protein